MQLTNHSLLLNILLILETHLLPGYILLLVGSKVYQAEMVLRIPNTLKGQYSFFSGPTIIVDLVNT